uniref:Uncharacterized protein n=1 Tax=Tetranychus urticae TaxID=32264 RepID=T1K091_TETUR
MKIKSPCIIVNNLAAHPLHLETKMTIKILKALNHYQQIRLHLSCDQEDSTR